MGVPQEHLLHQDTQNANGEHPGNGSQKKVACVMAHTHSYVAPNKVQRAVTEVQDSHQTEDKGEASCNNKEQHCLGRYHLRPELSTIPYLNHTSQLSPHSL